MVGTSELIHRETESRFKNYLEQNLPKDVLDKIAPVEPMRVEFETTISSKESTGWTNAVMDVLCNDPAWTYKRVRVTVEEIVEPKPCEHLYNENMFTKPKCSKCGAKR
jgi:hypothetical protein